MAQGDRFHVRGRHMTGLVIHLDHEHAPADLGLTSEAGEAGSTSDRGQTEG